MAKKNAATEHALVVLARSGHGADYKEIFHANRAANDKGELLITPSSSIDDAKELCIAEIRKHRAGTPGMDYRIKDFVSGTIIE